VKNRSIIALINFDKEEHINYITQGHYGSVSAGLAIGVTPTKDSYIYIWMKLWRYRRIKLFGSIYNYLKKSSLKDDMLAEASTSSFTLSVLKSFTSHFHYIWFELLWLLYGLADPFKHFWLQTVVIVGDGIWNLHLA
jgi:hypothetical protein